MEYTNSPLAKYANTNHKHYTGYRAEIKGVILHHMAARMTAKACADYFATTGRQVSSNYTVGYEADDIALCVPEKFRAWTTGGYDPDGYYVTIECSDAETTNYTVTDASIKTCIKLIADIFKRNGIKECKFDGTKEGSNLMAHRWFSATLCPGDFLYSKFSYIKDEVNKILKADDKPTTSTSDGKISYYVQTGVFGNKANADAYAKKLTAAGFPSVVKVKGDIDGDGDVDMEDVRKLLRKVTGLE